LQHVLHLHSALSLSFSNDPATTEIYTLSLHDALPILAAKRILVLAQRGPLAHQVQVRGQAPGVNRLEHVVLQHEVLGVGPVVRRSEEHTSELQSLTNLVCRLLLEKKKTKPQSDSDRIS